jgi:hypothetical protein
MSYGEVTVRRIHQHAGYDFESIERCWIGAIGCYRPRTSVNIKKSIYGGRQVKRPSNSHVLVVITLVVLQGFPRICFQLINIHSSCHWRLFCWHTVRISMSSTTFETLGIVSKGKCSIKRTFLCSINSRVNTSMASH